MIFIFICFVHRFIPNTCNSACRVVAAQQTVVLELFHAPQATLHSRFFYSLNTPMSNGTGTKAGQRRGRGTAQGHRASARAALNLILVKSRLGMSLPQSRCPADKAERHQGPWFSRSREHQDHLGGCGTQISGYHPRDSESVALEGGQGSALLTGSQLPPALDWTPYSEKPQGGQGSTPDGLSSGRAEFSFLWKGLLAGWMTDEEPLQG